MTNKQLKKYLLLLAIPTLSTLMFSAYMQATLAGNEFVSLASDKDIVVFNTSNGKFHKKSCRWAIKCTVHCIDISRAEAHRRGGIPCKVCNGGEG